MTKFINKPVRPAKVFTWVKKTKSETEYYPLEILGHTIYPSEILEYYGESNLYFLSVLQVVSYAYYLARPKGYETHCTKFLHVNEDMDYHTYKCTYRMGTKTMERTDTFYTYMIDDFLRQDRN